MKKILVIVAHQDDEVLGCGGTIVKHAENGDIVKVVTVADGVKSRKGTKIKNRNSQFKDACKIMGVKFYKSYNLKDNQLDSYPLLEVVKLVESEIESFQPNIVYTHSIHDLNVDHVVVHKALITACRGLPQSSVQEIYAFEVPSSSEWQSYQSGSFHPNVFVDIEKQFSKKMEALKAYAAEVREFPHTRSNKYIEALALVRGAQVGLTKAEAFVALRVIK